MARQPKTPEQNAAYYAANREQCRAQQAEYYRRNAEAIKARVAENRKLNPEDPVIHAARSRDYYVKVRAEKPTHYAEKRAARRALEASVTVGVVDFTSILETHGTDCHICLLAIPDGDLHFDHVIPLSRGGAHSTENLRPAHSRCNKSKGTRLMEEMV